MSVRTLAALALLLCLCACAHAATIVVDCGPFPSAEAAANADATVTWGDADPADDIACTEAFAACELQHFLRKVTGLRSDFAITAPGSEVADALVIRVGRAAGIAAADLAGLGPEGYVIRSGQANGKRTVLIAGGGRVGTLYGAYDFLHRLGVRWFAPGEVNEETPHVAVAAIPDLNLRETPAFLTRGFHAWENRGDRDFILWMARNRLNYWCVEQEPKGLLHKLGIMLVGGNHIITEWYLGPRAPYPYDHPRFTGDEGKPRDPYPVSAEYLGDANKDGRLSYFEAHPEWYGLIGGKRSDAINGDGGNNFCTSNPDAMAEFMRNATEDLISGRMKDADIVNAWTLDGGHWCECPQCRALGTPTDRTILFVHAYDQAIKRAQAAGRLHRPVRLLFLAYADVLQPPTRPLPAEFDTSTCIATYFPICRCYVHDFDDPACGTNASYNRSLLGWAQAPGRHYRGQLCIGEYYNVSGYKCLPACFMSTMCSDIPYYYSLGARHFHTMHCTTGNWGNKALTNWQMARQLWDPGVDCGVLWNDYFTGRYGRSYFQMRLFYESLEQMLCNITELKYGLARRLEQGPANLFPGSHLKYDRTAGDSLGPTLTESLQHAARCREIINGVLAQYLPDRIRARVSEDERLFTYGERTLAFYDALCRTYFALHANDRPAAVLAFTKAQALAGQLQADTTSASMSSTHASAPNALVASYAAGALTNLQRLLGPLDAAAARDFTPGETLVLRGTDFQGGGALLFGNGLWVYPGRIAVSEMGNYVYGQGTQPHDRMTAWFRLAAVPERGLTLTLVGLKCPRPAGGDLAGEVRVNDQVVFAGKVALGERELTRQEVAVPAGALKVGLNAVEIRNAEPNGAAGSRPWFGVDRVEVTGAE